MWTVIKMDEQGDESWEPATKRARFAKPKMVLKDKRQPLESYLKIHITALNGHYQILIPGLQTGRL